MSIHKNDAGTVFSIKCEDISEVLDVSSAIVLQIYFERPPKNSGSIFGPKDLDKPNGGEDGIVSYTWGSGELDTVGEWTYQVYLTFPWGAWKSDKGYFTVYDNLV